MFWITYLIGYIVFYIIARLYNVGEWTLGDRIQALLLSLSSWLGVVIIVFIVLVILLAEAVQSKKKVKW